jgi:hypothetical protein
MNDIMLSSVYRKAKINQKGGKVNMKRITGSLLETKGMAVLNTMNRVCEQVWQVIKNNLNLMLW